MAINPTIVHFSVVVPGSILSLTTQYVRETEQVKVLALCGAEDGRMHDGSLLTVFVLPVKELEGLSPVKADSVRTKLFRLFHFFFFFPNISFKAAGPGSIDRHGQLCSEILKVRLYEVPCPIQACVLGINRFFAYCHKKKLIQRFPLPQVFITPSDVNHWQCCQWLREPVCETWS